MPGSRAPSALTVLGDCFVSQAIQSGNVNLPTGTLNGQQRAYMVEASGQLQKKTYGPWMRKAMRVLAKMKGLRGTAFDPFARTHAFHAGLDFAAGLGTPIRSAAGGVVVFAGMRTDYGRVVEIDHGNGLKTRYAHASKLLVETGALVAPGDPIALVGSTGRSTGPHLHFEVLRGGTAVDPKRYLAGL